MNVNPNWPAELEQRIEQLEQENDELKAQLQSMKSSSLTRRAALGTILGGGALISVASEPVAAEASPWDDTDGDGDVELQADGADFEGKPAYDIQNINNDIEFVHKGRSIQDALTAAGSTGMVFIEENYDEGADTFPVTIDKAVNIRMASRSEINNPSTNTTFVVDHGGSNEYPGAKFHNVNIRNGGIGVDVQNARYVSFRDCKVESGGDHGVVIGERADKTNAIDCEFYNCMFEDCAGAGINLGPSSNGTLLVGTTCEQNGGVGLDTDTGVSIGAFRSSFQENDSYGVSFDNSDLSFLYGCYCENNSANVSAEIEINNAYSATIDSCYFQGFNNNTRAIVSSTNGGQAFVRNCLARNYTGEFILVNEGTDWDVYRQSHRLDSVPAFIDDFGTRTRSFGTIIPQDLSAVNGRYDGDEALSDGSNTTSGRPEHAVWDAANSVWFTMGGDTI